MLNVILELAAIAFLVAFAWFIWHPLTLLVLAGVLVGISWIRERS